jgi:hypothetical protein
LFSFFHSLAHNPAGLNPFRSTIILELGTNST